ncbi:MAG TPA: hypothetical protein VK619_13680 [Pyrinomonadaceae bacterium]|nr:hypothetical protein [Pyrinomonadaceae bacterium]
MALTQKSETAQANDDREIPATKYCWPILLLSQSQLVVRFRPGFHHPQVWHDVSATLLVCSILFERQWDYIFGELMRKSADA